MKYMCIILGYNKVYYIAGTGSKRFGILLSVKSFNQYRVRINHQLVNTVDDSARVRTNNGDII